MKSEPEALRQVMRISALEQDITEIQIRRVVLEFELNAARWEILVLLFAARPEPGFDYNFCAVHREALKRKEEDLKTCYDNLAQPRAR